VAVVVGCPLGDCRPGDEYARGRGGVFAGVGNVMMLFIGVKLGRLNMELRMSYSSVRSITGLSC